MSAGTLINSAIDRTNTTQRWLAAFLGKSRSTINNFANDRVMQPNDAVDIANALDDSELSMEMGHLMLGLIKAFTGTQIPRSLSALESYDNAEEEEEKAVYASKHIRMILADPEQLSDQQRADLKEYLFEKLDSTVMDLTLLTAGAEKLDLTIMDLFHEREPQYIKKHYLRKETAKTWK
ncbi:hypothetical protein [Lacticaseibacillus mingshuiensis]|uniref:hypothetical protein n=1 Tax=Lacticaseibacillus mingshuiensis TaxID=2799574 RepID=UPI00194E6ECD|nr:hypothetical protein [Lacticaseibacillus mingshuiensis]